MTDQQIFQICLNQSEIMKQEHLLNNNWNEKNFSTNLTHDAHNHSVYLATLWGKKNKTKLGNRMEIQNLGNSTSHNGILGIRLTLTLKTARKS